MLPNVPTMFCSKSKLPSKVSYKAVSSLLRLARSSKLILRPLFTVQMSPAFVLAQRSSKLVVTAEQKYKGVGRGGYPQDEQKASQLKMVADKMDAFFASSDEAAFDAVASPNITLHADLLILENDLSGADKVKQTVGMYTKNFDYKHQNIAHGADIDGSSVFHFWLHQVICILASTLC